MDLATYIMRNFQSLLITLLSLLLLLSYVHADIRIALKNTTDGSRNWMSYYRTEFFSYKYANTNGTMVGFLHQPTPNNCCLYIPPLPNPYPVSKDNQSVMWIAIIQDYQECVDDMVRNVRNAGYQLLVTSSPNDTNSTLTSHTKNLAFPIVVIRDYYMKYLVETALSELGSPEMLATVSTGIDTFIATFVIGFAFILAVCCFLCFTICFCRSYRRRRRQRALFDYETRNLEQQRRNYGNYQARDQMARQELIESILRQLQELQLDGQLQTPLGAERTKQLPIEKFGGLGESMDGQGETCAICVDDLKVGETLRVLPCNHHFHQDCIDEWLINHSDLCPLCKKQVPRGESSEQSERRGRGRRRQGGGRVGIGARPQEDQLVLFTDDDSETESSDGNDNRTRSSLLAGLNGEQRYGSV